MALDNATILNAIRLSGSSDYQNRIPEATQSNLDAVQKALYDPTNRNIYNEFETGLINRVGTVVLNDWKWSNPLAKFKREGLLEQGAMIEEIAMDLIEAQGYDIRDSNLFKTNKNEVYSAFHTINREDRYDLSISRTELRKAFVSSTGLSDFLSRKLSIPGKSDQYDEFRIMVQLMAIAYNNDNLHKVKVSIVDAEEPTEAELKNLSTKIRTVAKKMAVVPTGLYNAKGVPTVSDPSSLVLITTPGIMASLSVNVLADAFNISHADFAQNVVEIDEFPMAGVYAMLVDKAWFVCGDFVNEMDSWYNPKNRVENFYLHRWGTYSVSPFSNAVIFGDATGTAADIVTTVLASIAAKFVDENGATVTTFSYGDAPKVVVSATGTITPANDKLIVPDAATYVVSLTDPEGKIVALNSRTYVDRTGVLYVQAGAHAGSTVTVVATSTYVDPSGSGVNASPLTATATLTVV